MRLTNKLLAQHIGWHFKKHWKVQGHRVPRDTGAEAELKKFGIEVKDALHVIRPERHQRQEVEIGVFPQALPHDDTHPDWHRQPCYTYEDHNVLLEGLAQAQVLTKTIEVSGFPKNIEEGITRLQISSQVDRAVQNAIMASHVFDAEQVKLPKVKLPERPAFNLPRDYGVSHERRNRLLVNKLIAECEKLAGRSVTSRRRLIDDAGFKVTLPNGEDLLQFNINVNKLITTVKPIEQVKGKYDAELPDLYPLKCTITMPKRKIYTTNTFFPLSSAIACSHPHTLFLHFDKEYVGNLHESSVTNSQFHSRTLLKAFTVAAARAKQLYGDGAINSLPKPIVVQSIQTDGHTFHFGVFQLNTLKLNGYDGLKNYWFHQPNMNLFTECGYKAGRPLLEGYNKDIIRCLNVFYNNS